MTPEQIQMICDATDQAGAFVLWVFLFLAGLVVIALVMGLFGGLAIRFAIRYIRRRMAEGTI